MRGVASDWLKSNLSNRKQFVNIDVWSLELLAVSALSVDPLARGRLVRKRADSSVKLLARLSDNLTGG